MTPRCPFLHILTCFTELMAMIITANSMQWLRQLQQEMHQGVHQGMSGLRSFMCWFLSAG